MIVNNRLSGAIKTSVYAEIEKYEDEDQPSVKLVTQYYIKYNYKINEYCWNLTPVTRTTKNTTFCCTLSKFGVTCMRKQPIYFLKPEFKIPF